MTAWRLALAGAALLARAAPTAPAPAPNADAGQAIYQRGVLPSGAPLLGTREDGARVTSGADAACVNCHQRSGLGGTEGRLLVPPVTGDYLFHSRGNEPGEIALPYVNTLHGNRDAYTEATLARAIREGLDSEGRPLDYLMPRYALSDADMSALVDYLKRLDVRRAPGVTESTLHLATVITPDADPVKRRAMLDVLEAYVQQKNQFPLQPSKPMRTSGRTQYSKSMYMANRRWQLHVWELSGPAAGWRAQLDKRFAAEPVFAVLSGLGGHSWAPVHEFCERHSVPCLFPNVEVPVEADLDFYPLYFSRGVLLEADLVAQQLLAPDRQPAVSSVEQVYRAGESGEAAAAALAAALKGRGVAVHDVVLPAGGKGPGVAAALRGSATKAGTGGRALVLWLHAPDLAALGEPPAGLEAIYVSGLMGGLEQAPLPAPWRGAARMTYPFDVPDRRGIRLDYPLRWFAVRHIPVVAPQVQADTYLACSLLAEVLNHMADNTVPPYLVEQLQDILEHRIITGYYPHLALASRQRFASKGGYVVRFRDPTGTAVVAQSNWIVP